MVGTFTTWRSYARHLPLRRSIRWRQQSPRSRFEHSAFPLGYIVDDRRSEGFLENGWIPVKAHRDRAGGAAPHPAVAVHGVMTTLAPGRFAAGSRRSSQAAT